MRSGFRLGAMLAGLSSMGVAGPLAASPAVEGSGRVYGYENIRRMLQRHGRSRRVGHFDPKLNRHTRAPHEHRREIARRTTTPERAAAMAAARVPS